MAARLQLISLDQIDDHPKNPRVVFRDDVVAGIVASLNGEWPQKHAIHVRLFNGRYQILSGHHRKKAATQAGIESIWCWVDDVDDAQAFMELVTSNNQGELDPLEIGIHAFEAVPNNRGKKGGGIQEYAARLGKSKQTLSELRHAGEVASEMSTDDRIHFLGKASHLAAIHKLPRECWQACCEWLAKNQSSVSDVEERVEQAEIGKTTRRQIALFKGETTGRELARIIELVAKVSLDLADWETLKAEWDEWATATDPVDIKVVQAKRIEFEDRLSVLTATPAPERPNLVLADPPWRYDFAETDSRQIENQYPSATVEEIIDMSPDTEPDCVLFMWATVAKLPEAMRVLDGWGFEYKTSAVWDKEKIGMGYWFRGQHELLLVATKGTFSPPDESVRVSSVFREARKKHSEKPECVYEWIETAFPQAKKLEMFCRNHRAGWEAVGNECSA